MAETETPPAVLFEQLRAGQINIEIIRWLSDACEAWERADGALPLDRCMRLPTKAQRRLQERDYRLAEAAKLLGPCSTRSVAEDLAKRLDAFLTRGAWRDWQGLKAPPAQASELDAALFELARALDGKPAPGARRIAQVLETFSG